MCVDRSAITKAKSTGKHREEEVMSLISPLHPRVVLKDTEKLSLLKKRPVLLINMTIPRDSCGLGLQRVGDSPHST